MQPHKSWFVGVWAIAWLVSVQPACRAQMQPFAPPVARPHVALGFDATDGAHPGYYHTGIDYSDAYGTPILASDFGKVVYTQYMGSGDHGMGDCVIVEHMLFDGTATYTLDAHMSNITVSNGQFVHRGQQIGNMGGSGYGNPHYWPTHVHHEQKTLPVTNNPIGSYPYWGYTPRPAENYGYANPATYIGHINSLTDDMPYVCNLYRYYKPDSGDHFYTTHITDLWRGQYGYYFERIQCHVYSGSGSYLAQLYRYWNGSDHFYTTDFTELYWGAGGYVFERVECYVYQWNLGGTIPLYRYYNPGIGKHFYTTDWSELGWGNYGYHFEHVQGYVLP